ncbi:MAG: HAD-IC family P-type ATPase [Oscillospiraceae bacterium]|nr:HAD-IC family P-type ATPase [Oscillospiraceae bacterium]
MSKNRHVKIQGILAIPEKIKSCREQLLRLRFPLQRVFSGRDILLGLLPLILLAVCHAVAVLRSFLQPACIVLALISLVPLAFEAAALIGRRALPLEQLTVLISTVPGFLLEPDAAVLIPACTVLLHQAQAYALLHREAELNGMRELAPELRAGPEKCDAEKSAIGALLASCGLGWYVLLAFIALVLAVVLLFHLPEASGWLRAVTVALVLSGPSAVLYATQLLHFAVFCSAAKTGIAYSDDMVPEEYRACRLFAFSKTGTVTDGRYEISEVEPAGITTLELLRIAAIAESQAEHPIARTLRSVAELPEDVQIRELQNVQEIPGRGVSALISGKQVYVGNAALLEEHGIWFNVPSNSGSAVHVAVDGEYRGYIMMADRLREKAFDALEELRAEGAGMLVMLTGDVRSAARALASSLNFDMVKPELGPTEKASAVRYLRSVHGERARIACVGDGTHDAQMFQQSDIAVCMNAGKDNTAEVNLYEDDIMAVPRSYRICRKAARMLWICVALTAALKLLLLILGITGVVAPGAAAAVDCACGAGTAVYALTGFSLD